MKGTLRGKITGGGLNVDFAQDVKLAAKESKEITVLPEDVPSLNLLRPKLWWPYQMGEPFLHKLTLEFHDLEENDFGYAIDLFRDRTDRF